MVDCEQLYIIDLRISITMIYSTTTLVNCKVILMTLSSEITDYRGIFIMYIIVPELRDILSLEVGKVLIVKKVFCSHIRSKTIVIVLVTVLCKFIYQKALHPAENNTCV